MKSAIADIDFGDDYPTSMPDVPQTFELPTPDRVITPVAPRDPSMLGYPPTLLVELALRSAPLQDILDGYNIGEKEWEVIRQDPAFIADLARTAESLKETGAGFKMKAQLQAEELLQTSWRMIHDQTVAPAIRAKLIESTVQWSGLAPKNAGVEQVAAGAGFSISINFNGDQKPPRIVGEQ